MKFRVGLGYDVHRLDEGESLWLGGVEIPHQKGTVAHSDGDVVIHALADALLGAAGLSDIGTYFPDTDMAFKDIDSKKLLAEVVAALKNEGYRIGNVDCVISAQQPKLKPHIPSMKSVLAKILKISVEDVGIKATTTEKLGFEGREEGISVQAIALVIKD